MPIKEFSGDVGVAIRSGQGDTTFSLPAVDVTLRAVPRRPDGPAFRELLDGRRRERRASGWYLDVDIEWEELSIAAHANLISLIDAMHARGGTDEVFFCPSMPWDASMEYRVVPAIDEDAAQIIYSDRVRERPGTLILKAHHEVTELPSWFD